jgi:hypothetical protein
VRKYVNSPTTRKGIYPSKIGSYKVVYKVKNKGIREKTNNKGLGCLEGESGVCTNASYRN